MSVDYEMPAVVSHDDREITRREVRWHFEPDTTGPAWRCAKRTYIRIDMLSVAITNGQVETITLSGDVVTVDGVRKGRNRRNGYLVWLGTTGTETAHPPYWVADLLKQALGALPDSWGWF